MAKQMDESSGIGVRKTKQRHKVSDYELIAVIGKGGYGEVRVVKKKDTGEVLAMKSLLKSKMIEKDQISHVVTERNLMATVDNWLLVRLHLSFQDVKNLYFVMEYCPGGDLMKLLIKEDIFPEDVTRFYMGECARAIDVLHTMDFVHRDLKPDNILIGKDGHIKLSDFGLAKHNAARNDTISKWQGQVSQDLEREAAELKKGRKGGRGDKDKKGFTLKISMFGSAKARSSYKRERALLYSAVGTPNYIAPEVLNKQGYGRECDWWSLGTIMFECLCGYPPFFHETPLGTCRKILRYREFLRVPRQCGLSKEAKDCIFRLICSPKKRMNFAQIKRHSFFKRVPWHDLRKMRPPFIPEVKSAADTKYFDKVKDVDLSFDLPDDGGDGLSAPREHRKKKSSFNNIDPRGVCRDVDREDLARAARDSVHTDSPTKGRRSGAGSNLGVNQPANHFYGFTFERIPVEKHE